jgi:hypothetical protein
MRRFFEQFHGTSTPAPDCEVQLFLKEKLREDPVPLGTPTVELL